MRCWDPEKARAFLDAARDDRLYVLYVLALSTGMREGELLALRWRDVRLPSPGDAGAGRARLREHEQGSVHVQNTLHWRESGQDRFGLVMSLEEVKTDGSRRHIQLSAVATEALREHRARQSAERLKMGPIWRHHDLVFCNTIGGSDPREQLSPAVLSAADKEGRGCRVSVRTTCGIRRRRCCSCLVCIRRW